MELNLNLESILLEARLTCKETLKNKPIALEKVYGADLFAKALSRQL